MTNRIQSIIGYLIVTSRRRTAHRNGVGQRFALSSTLALALMLGTFPAMRTPIPAAAATTALSIDCSTIPAYPEIRPDDNSYANQTPGQPTDPNAFYGEPNWYPYYAQIDGNCTGTTEQILEWAARKWGFGQLGYPDLAKSIGIVESWWREPTVGIHGEVGILQVNPVWPGWEMAQWSTAYSADYAMAVIRSHYDGNSWLGGQTAGDLYGSVAAWECGCAYNGGGWYATRVFNYNDNNKLWQRPGVPPDWF